MALHAVEYAWSAGVYQASLNLLHQLQEGCSACLAAVS